MPSELQKLEDRLVFYEREIRRLKAWKDAIAAGSTVRATSITGVLPAGNIIHALYGSAHVGSLHVTAGALLITNYQNGFARIDETWYSVAAGTIAVANNTTNYIFVSNVGVVTTNTTGFPTNCVPLAEVVTAGGVITVVSDRRSYLYGHHGPVFVGNVKIGGYVRVGDVSAPTNVTAGDLTVTRLLVGSNLALPTGQFFRAVGPSFTPDGATDASMYVGGSWTPGGAGGAAVGLQASYTIRPTIADAAHEGYGWSLAVTHDSGDFALSTLVGVQANVLKNIAAGTAVLANMKGFRASVRPAAGVITNIFGIECVMGAGADAATVTTSYGAMIRNRVGYAVTNQYGLYIESLTGGGTLNIGIRLGDCAQGALWFDSDTANQVAGIVWGTIRDVNLYRSAANLLKTDDSLEVAIDMRLAAVAADPAYVDGKALLYFYSSGGVDELRVRGKIGVTETQVMLADLSP